jgi:protoheme IX farnesyltransferase
MGEFVRDVVALAKPRLTALVLCTTAGGLWLAGASFGAARSLWCLLGTTLAVAGAHTLNSWMERDLDAQMERTRNRPLAARRFDARLAFVLGVVYSIVSLPVLWWGVNALTGLLGAVALTSYVLVYTPLKTRSPAALYVGAIPGALPPLMGFTAVRDRIELPGLVLFAVLFVWQLPHFLAIAIHRKDDYARAGIRVFPLVRGDRAARTQIIAWVLALVPITAVLYSIGVAGALYLVASLVLGGAFLAASLRGLRSDVTPRWARTVFLVSLLHLTGLFVALMLDVR